jgi:hypothetical protein
MEELIAQIIASASRRGETGRRGDRVGGVP